MAAHTKRDGAGDGPAGRRNRTRIDDALRIEMAIRRYSSPETVPIAELAKIYQRDPAVISRAISRAFSRGLVEVRASGSAIAQREYVLEKRLLKRYPQLEGALIVRVRETAAPDEIHRFAGAAMGRSVADGTAIRSGDTVGIGPGRGIYHMIETVRERRGLRARDIMLVSLCGDIYPLHDSNELNLRLDSDTNVNLLGQAFDHKVEFRMASHPIGYHSPGFKSEKADTFFGKHWGDRRPDSAYLGVGVVTGVHRVAVLARKKGHFLLQEPLRKDLARLLELCEKYKRTGGPGEAPYFPVAETAVNLFYVPDRADRSSNASSRLRQFDPLIQSINDRLFAVSWKGLAGIPSVFLIAGGLAKTGAIRYLLGGGPAATPLRVRFLCTDHRVAELLLRD